MSQIVTLDKQPKVVEIREVLPLRELLGSVLCVVIVAVVAVCSIVAARSNAEDTSNAASSETLQGDYLQAFSAMAPEDIADLDRRLAQVASPGLKRTMIVAFFCAKPYYAVQHGPLFRPIIEIPDSEVGKHANELWAENGGRLTPEEDSLESAVRQGCFMMPVLR